MDFYAKYRKVTVVDGDIANVAKFIQKHAGTDYNVSFVIEELAGTENRSDILLMICTLCIISGNEVDFNGTALWNAVVTKQKENVDILLKFGACYKRIQFDTVDERTRFYDCLTDMNLEIVDCTQKNCQLCNEDKTEQEITY